MSNPRDVPVPGHPTFGSHRITGTPIKVSGMQGRPTTSAPLPGEHTKSILMEFFGLDNSAINDFAPRQVLFESWLPADRRGID